MYDVHGDRLWREAQQRNDASYRGVAVRGECIYRRLVGSLLHECIHAYCGDVTKANYGVLFGLPYGVPTDVPEKDEEAYLDTFNFGEARAWVGVWIVGRRMFGLDWDLRTARDIGTYCFVGGNAPRACGRRLSSGRAHRSPASPRALLREGPQDRGARTRVVRRGRPPRGRHPSA